MTYNAKDFTKSVRANRPCFSLTSCLLRTVVNNREVRLRLLTFMEDLPIWKTNSGVMQSLRLHLETARNVPLAMHAALLLSRMPILGGVEGAIAVWMIKHRIASHFIVEGTLRLKVLAQQYAREGAGVVVDLLGERALSRRQADINFTRYIDLIQNPPLLSEASFHVAVKFSSLCENFRSRGRGMKDVLSERFATLLEEAKRNRVFVWVDAEEYDVCHLTEEIFLDVISRKDFSNICNVGIALQAYRKDAIQSAQRFVEQAYFRGTPFSVRIVKGAYWDSEFASAKETGRPFPLFERKEKTDESFEACCEYFLRNAKKIHLVGATHSPEQIVNLFNAAERLGISRNQMPECHVLFGAGEPIRRTLCKLGLPVKVYMPVGDLGSGMAFLARRIVENTSSDNFLAQLLQ